MKDSHSAEAVTNVVTYNKTLGKSREVDENGLLKLFFSFNEVFKLNIIDNLAYFMYFRLSAL